MAWTRTTLEVPAITGDLSVPRAAPPPDGEWTQRLDRTVSSAKVLNGPMDPVQLEGYNKGITAGCPVLSLL